MRRSFVVAAVAALLTVSVLLVTGRAGAQTGGRLDLVAQTTWIGELPAAVDLRISGAPDDARLAVRIFEPVTTRDQVRASYDGPAPDALLLAFFEVVDLESARVGSGEVISIVMPDEEIGLLLRRAPGALVVVIELLSEDDVLDTLVTHFLVDGPSSDPLRNLSVAFVYDMRQPLAINSDLTIDLSEASLETPLDFLASRADVPVAIRLNGETLDALEGDPIFETIRDLISTRELMLEPWVDLDEEAWRAVGESEMIISQYSAGRSSTMRLLSTTSTGIVRLDRDATADTIAVLRAAGAGGFLVDPDQLRLFSSVGELHNPVQLADGDNITAPTLSFDLEILETLSGSDSELAAQHAVAELALVARNLDLDGSEVIDVTDIDPVALDVLLKGIAGSDKIKIVGLPEAFSQPYARISSGLAIHATLRSDPAPDYASAAADLQLTRSTLDSYSSMVAPAEAPILPLRQILEAAVSSSLTLTDIEDFTSVVFDTISQGTQGITVVKGQRVTLASRTADLPLLIRNEQSLPVTVDLFLRAEKLRFPDGDHRTITLAPGDNPLIVRVETLASGDARVTTTLTSPDGRLEIARGSVDIRSTAISGLGLVISLISLGILATWWGRTILRVRRNRAAASFTRSEEGSSNGDPDSELGEPCL